MRRAIVTRVAAKETILRLPLTFIALVALAMPALAEPQSVRFPGEGVTLSAIYYRPSGPGPFPAVVALHGCGGLNNSDGSLNARHRDWGERLSAQGFAVLLPDSFASRGLGSQCSVVKREVRPSRERVADARAALAWLQGLPEIKPEAVNLLGWSNGGSTVLYGVRPAAAPAAGPDFAKAVAFYPGCRVPLQGGAWRTRMPLLMLVGEADDWTGVEPCRDLAKAAQARGEKVELVTYPGAYHDFDHPSAKLRLRTGLGFTVNDTGEAHTGTDPAARADALTRVPVYLAR